MLFYLIGLSGCAWQNQNDSHTPSPLSQTIPTATHPSLPDLEIITASIEVIEPADGDCSSPQDVYRIAVTIGNKGVVAAGIFDVQVNESEQSVSSGLAPGEQVELFFPYNGPKPIVLVDHSGKIEEDAESNNIFSEVLPLPTLPPICLATPTPSVLDTAPLFTLEGHTGRVMTARFSPDGRLIASGATDDTMRLWTTLDGALLRTMQGHTFPILCLEFSPDGVNLASGSMDGLIRLWRVSNSSLQSTLSGHAGWVTTLTYAPDGQWLASGSDDFTVRIWRPSRESLVQTIDEGMAAVRSIDFSPDGQSLVWAEADGVVRVRGLSGGWQHHFTGPSAATDVKFMPLADQIAAGYEDGTIQIWSLEDGSLKQSLKIGAGSVTGISFSSDGRWLAVASDTGNLWLYPIDKAVVADTPAVKYRGHTGRINSVDFSPTGTLIVSAGDDQTVRLWETP